MKGMLWAGGRFTPIKCVCSGAVFTLAVSKCSRSKVEYSFILLRNVEVLSFHNAGNYP
jgi:hypothetical protein